MKCPCANHDGRFAPPAHPLTSLTSLAAFTVPARAAEQPLTLTQAIEQAVGSNADLRRERIAIDVADAQLEAARGAVRFPAELQC